MENKSKYPIGGYAPGNYMCNCTTCKTQFQGDKRAVQCEPCAVKMVKEQVQTLIENNREIAEKEEQKQYLIDIMKADGELGLYEKCDFVDIVNENFWDLIDKPVKEGYVEKGDTYTEEDLREAFSAGCAFTIGSHKDFQQTHPDFKEWLNNKNK